MRSCQFLMFYLLAANWTIRFCFQSAFKISVVLLNKSQSFRFICIVDKALCGIQKLYTVELLWLEQRWLVYRGCFGKIPEVQIWENFCERILYFYLLYLVFLPRYEVCKIGWLVGCFGFNGPLRQYFSLYRAVCQ